MSAHLFPQWLDEHMPYRGKCALCGDADTRHRVVDAIRSRYKAGEPIGAIAGDYRLPLAFVGRIIQRKRLR